MTIELCPLCGCVTAECDQLKGGSFHHYRCSNCTEFAISVEAEESMYRWTRETKNRLIAEAKAISRPDEIYVITAKPQPPKPEPWLQGVPHLRSEFLAP